MADDEQRYRLVVLGAGRVGKSSIVSRFLHGKFVEAYKPTVEDLHCRTFHVDGSVVQVIALHAAGFTTVLEDNNINNLEKSSRRPKSPPGARITARPQRVT